MIELAIALLIGFLIGRWSNNQDASFARMVKEIGIERLADLIRDDREDAEDDYISAEEFEKKAKELARRKVDE
jgi:ATP:corrinoid adenosyltransferase